MKQKNAFAFVILILFALIIGSVITIWTQDIEWLKWLTYGQTIGISPDTPITIDLSLLKITFGMEIKVNAIQVILLILAFISYNQWFSGE